MCALQWHTQGLLGYNAVVGNELLRAVAAITFA